MNTASRMESTSERNKIQVSHETAELLIAAGREKWVTERSDKILAKGKGVLQTYFLNLRAGSSESGSTKAPSQADSHGSKSVSPGENRLKPTLSRVEEDTGGCDDGDSLPKKATRLVHWNVDILAKILKQIVAHRLSSNVKTLSKAQLKHLTYTNSDLFKEVKDVIALPKFDAKTFQHHVDPSSVELSPEVLQQLTGYITRVAQMYRDNPFHNFVSMNPCLV